MLLLVFIYLFMLLIVVNCKAEWVNIYSNCCSLSLRLSVLINNILFWARKTFITKSPLLPKLCRIQRIGHRIQPTRLVVVRGQSESIDQFSRYHTSLALSRYGFNLYLLPNHHHHHHHHRRNFINQPPARNYNQTEPPPPIDDTCVQFVCYYYYYYYHTWTGQESQTNIWHALLLCTRSSNKTCCKLCERRRNK